MKKKQINTSRTPIYRDAGFELYDAETMGKAFKEEHDVPATPDNFIYSRYRNPTVIEAENKIMQLESCNWALLTQSGMSAIDVALSVFQRADKPGRWLFFTEIYGGTNTYIDSVLVKRRGINIIQFEPDNELYDLDKFEDILKAEKPDLVFLEIISNPLLIVVDIKKIISLAHSYGAKVIIDNTFATSYLLKPLDIGADLVIHSATKYLGGHGNITAGVVCGSNEELRKEATDYRKFAGHMISADDAYRLTTQMESFRLRVKQQFANSIEVAKLLNESDKISRVWFPGLDSHPSHKYAEQLFAGKGYGAIISFDMSAPGEKEKRMQRDRFIANVSDRIKLIPTLGDSHTIIMPVEPVWGYKYPEPGMVRLSVGFEETEDLLNVISEALAKIK